MCAFNKSLKRLLATGLVAFFGVVYSTSALAVGTTPDTAIDNVATVGFKVGGVDQTAVPSNTTTFEVDQVVDLTVAEADGVDTNVSPAETGAVARFTVTNTGNATQDFKLSVADLIGGDVFGNTDNIQTDALTIVIDANGNDVYDAGTDQVQSFIDELSAVSGSNVGLRICPGRYPCPTRSMVMPRISSSRLRRIKAGAAGSSVLWKRNPALTMMLACRSCSRTTRVPPMTATSSGAATLDAVKTSQVVSDPLRRRSRQRWPSPVRSSSMRSRSPITAGRQPPSSLSPTLFSRT